jgi:hypothetical protein
VVAKYILAHGDESECRIQEITIVIPELDFRISTRTEFHCQPRAVREQFESSSRFGLYLSFTDLRCMDESRVGSGWKKWLRNNSNCT